MDESPQQRLVAWLRAHPGAWSSAELARALGVTDRSVRNYVVRLNAEASAELVERTAKGYRLTALSADPVPVADSEQPTGAARREYAVLRRLLTSSDPVGIYDLAEELGVSESTINKDIRRLAKLAAAQKVTISRSGDWVGIEGGEANRRQLMRQAITEAADPGTMLATARMEAAYTSYDIRELKRHVADALTAHGLHSNDYTLNPLILDLVIAADRITDDFILDELAAEPDTLADSRLEGAASEITGYLSESYGVTFSQAETTAVAMLVASKTTLLRGATDHDVVIDHVGAGLVELVRTILVHLDETYLVDLADDAFVTSLALHTHNLLLRARAGRPQRNPLAAAIRAGHPLVHELAVFFTRELERETGVGVDPDEVGFIAFHLGAALDRQRDDGERVTLTLVAPGYHELADRIAEWLATHLGDRARVIQILETAEPAPEDLAGELVISPIPITGVHPTRLVLIGPMLGDSDIALVDTQVRAQHRRNTWIHLMGQLHELFHDGLFFRSPAVAGRDELLALLCGALRSQGAVREDFLDQVCEREELSSTAFNDIVAIPHTLGMPAERTRIAVATFDRPLDWNGTPVRLVLLIAYSGADRNLVRDTFDQLVIALSEPANVRRLLDHGQALPDFLSELSRLMHND